MLRAFGLLMVLVPHCQVQEKVLPARPVQADVRWRLLRPVRWWKREHVVVFLPVVLSTLLVLLKVTVLVLLLGIKIARGDAN